MNRWLKKRCAVPLAGRGFSIGLLLVAAFLSLNSVAAWDDFLTENAANIGKALAYLRAPLAAKDSSRIERLADNGAPVTPRSKFAIQRLLDPYCLTVVRIHSDLSVTVTPGGATPRLQQGGWASFPIKIHNEAGHQGRLKVKSPNAELLFVESRGEETVQPEEMFTMDQLQKRFLAISLYRNKPMEGTLTGEPVEYAILQIHSKKSGHLTADIDFYLGDYYRNMKVIDSEFLGTSDQQNKVNGLKGEYFNNNVFSGKPVMVQTDERIDFDWSNQSDGNRVDTNEFCVRWTGWLHPQKTGRYRIGTRSNDGSRLYLNGELVVGNWGLHGSTLKTAEVDLVGGRPVALLMEYYQGGGSANAQLEWDDGPLNPSRIQMEFESAPAIPVVFNITDENGEPAMASFVITDGVDRNEYKADKNNGQYGQHLNHGLSDYDRRAEREYEYYPEDLKGIYPLPSRRLPLIDKYPDHYFHAQVYRKNGEQVLLPPGSYRITYTRGPEYIARTQELNVPASTGRVEASFQLKRWIHLSRHGYYSSDSHIHASGCCHYNNPEEGLRPEYISRIQQGEDLNVANILNWGPNWNHQKQFFTGHDHPLSGHDHLLRYNVEVSGFPSSHAGHVVLLGLIEDDYPGTDHIGKWPSWNIPILRWAKRQNAITGYAHSGWGLTPMSATWELPNYILPQMNDIGANEFVAAVTAGVVDFYSVGDTPITWELNMWYHSLNCGYRTMLSGETDYPCIYDERVGEVRSYVKLSKGLDYEAYLEALRLGRGYVSDGRTHLINTSIDGVALGENGSELKLNGKRRVTIVTKVAALLPEERTKLGSQIASSELSRQPYWHVERARVGEGREIKVELVVNGRPVMSKKTVADGDWGKVTFDYQVKKSSWLALRVFPSAHTNPFFVIVDGKPIRDLPSAEWMRRALDQCWKTKKDAIREEERGEAFEAFERAGKIFDSIIAEAKRSDR